MTISAIEFINIVFRLLEMLIIAEVVISWVAPHSENSIIQIIRSITAPLLIPGRKLQARFSSEMPVDFSPFIAIILLDFVKMFIITLVR